MEKHANETWAPVIGYEGMYEVSDHGRVRSVGRMVTRKGTKPFWSEGRVLKTTKNQCGHFKVNLWRGNKGRMFYIHRLMYEAFAGAIPEGYDVHHIDGNPQNNVLTNMRITTHAEHIGAHSRGKNLSEGHKLAISRAKSKPVSQFSLDGDMIATYPSAKEADKQTGISYKAISQSLRGKTKTSGGYRWRFMEG